MSLLPLGCAKNQLTNFKPSKILLCTFRETKMGLNAKEIPLRLCKILLASCNKSYRFVQRHPVVSGVFSVFLVFYIFLSYIYNFLAYLSPFILVAAIFIRIFWSSEQPQLRYVKRERRRNELKHPRVVASKYGRSDFVLDSYYSHSSHHTISRRRHYRDKKWGSHGGNSGYSSAASERNTENKEVSSLERSRKRSSDYGMPAEKLTSPNRQTLRSQPSLSDLVRYGNLEGIRDDDNEESKDDSIKAVEWTENDQKNSMNLGYSELETKTRMETLIANRRARKVLKMRMDKDLNPCHPAPVFVTKNINFAGPRGFGEFVGTEMPDSAPSVIQPSRTFNHLYNPSEEKPIFHQEFTEGHQKDKTFSRHASFSLVRFRRSPDKGNHDRLIEQMFSTEEGIFESDESGLNSPTPQSNNSNKTSMAGMKEKGVENAHSTKSVSVPKTSNNGFAEIDQNISSFQRAGVSKEPESRVHNKAPEKLLNFPISNSTAINEYLFNSLASPIEKNQENMFYARRRICKTPAYSVASDLQVEVSEVGSPTRTFDGSNSSSDKESSVYDGDNERDITSGSEDMWGNSIHAREVHGVGDLEDTAEANNNPNKDILSPFPLQEIDEENSADVSSVSSTCDLPGDTPTCAVGQGYNIFSNMRETVMNNETAQPLNSSDVSSSRANLEILEEWCNPFEAYKNEAKYVNDSATIDKDHIDNKTSNPSTLQQRSIEEVFVHSNSSFLPRPLLPKKTLTDEVSSSAFDQQIHKQVPQSTKMEDMAKTISSGELRPEVMPNNMQPLINDPSPTVQSHDGVFSNSQVTIQKNYGDEAKSDIEAKKDVQGNSVNLAEKEVIDLTEPAAGTHSVNAPTVKKALSNIENEVESQTSIKQEPTEEPHINARTKDLRTANGSEGKQNALNENEAIVSSRSVRESHKLSETAHSEEPGQVPNLESIKPSKLDEQNDIFEEASHLQSKSKNFLEDDMKEDKPTNGHNIKDSLQPMVTEVTISRSAEDIESKSEKVKMREAIEQGSNEIEAKFSSKSVGDSDKIMNTANIEGNVKVPEPGKPNDSSELVEGDTEKDNTSNG